MSLISQQHLQDEEAAYAWVEAHVWPKGPQCPHCSEQKRVSKMQGNATRVGLHKCYACRKQFRVTVGTIFEKSHVALHLWLQAFYLIAGSKKGISANQLHRTLGVTLKTAWFMGHRIREAMRVGSLVPPMGSDGGVVEIDETIYGRAASHPVGRAGGRGYYNAIHKNVVLSLVERGGEVRSFHVEGSTVSQVIPVVKDNVAREAAVMTDGAPIYKRNLADFASHDRVDHSADEYVRYEDGRPPIHTNTVEGYFSLFKRGMRGTYQHCKEKHLHRYLAEFDFRYNNRVRLGVNDEQRAAKMVKGAVGKRLTYRTTDRKVASP
jgi:transposase-like protein